MMPRYRFNLFNSVTIVDDEGTVLPDLEAARTFAIANIRQVGASDVLEGHLHLGHRVEIMDEKGVCVATLYFREVISVDDSV
jgi:hypothetical protein